MDSSKPTLAISLTVTNGNAAIDFYVKAFNAKELFRMPLPNGSIAHAELMIGNSKVYLSEADADWHATPLPEGMLAPSLIAITVADCDEAYAQALAAGATSLREPETHFWGTRSAMVSDNFGYRWNVNQIIEEITPEEMHRRASELFSS